MLWRGLGVTCRANTCFVWGLSKLGSSLGGILKVDVSQMPPRCFTDDSSMRCHTDDSPIPPDVYSIRCRSDASQMPRRCLLNGSLSTSPPSWFLLPHCSSMIDHQWVLISHFSPMISPRFLIFDSSSSMSPHPRFLIKDSYPMVSFARQAQTLLASRTALIIFLSCWITRIDALLRTFVMHIRGNM